MNDIVKDTLIDDLKTILTERMYNMCEENIFMHHEIGERLRQEGGKITELVQRCAVILNMSERKLWDCVKIYDDYPDIKQVTTGKNISVSKLLGRSSDIPQIPAKVSLETRFDVFIKELDGFVGNYSPEEILKEIGILKEKLNYWEKQLIKGGKNCK